MMEKKNKESEGILVLVAARNGERYIGEQLDSILNQTVPGIRILVSDDCSQDRTPQIAGAYAKRFPGQVQVWRRGGGSFSGAALFRGPDGGTAGVCSAQRPGRCVVSL